VAAFQFNAAKGRVAELFLRAPNGVVVLLEAAEADSVLKDYDTLNDILAVPGNVELAHASYVRKTGIGGVVTIDNALDESRVDIAPVTWTALEGNPIVKALVCYQEVASGIIIPLSGHDWPMTPDGSDLTLRFA